MAGKVLPYKYRDTRPTIRVTFRNPDGTAYDLTGHAVTWHLILQHTSTKVSRTMTVDADPTTGKATYTPLDADWNTIPEGLHQMEAEAVKGTQRVTEPNDGYDLFDVSGDIGQA